jgi:hypothetical protein
VNYKGSEIKLNDKEGGRSWITSKVSYVSYNDAISFTNDVKNR